MYIRRKGFYAYGEAVSGIEAAKLNIPITVFESDIFESVYHVENVNPDTVVGYKSKGVKYSFLDEYDNEE